MTLNSLISKIAALALMAIAVALHSAAPARAGEATATDSVRISTLKEIVTLRWLSGGEAPRGDPGSTWSNSSAPK